jgi:hypothetical protein
MIVRETLGDAQTLIGQTEHSRLVGQLGAHWGNKNFDSPEPYESVARAAAFHDFGWLRYEASPGFNESTKQTPDFKKIPADPKRLTEYAWCVEWLLGEDPYAANLVSMHRTGLWRGRYGTMEHPSMPIRTQPPEVDEFIAAAETRQASELKKYGWDVALVRRNFHLLQVWDLLGLYFTCQEPYEDYMEPVPMRDGKVVRMTLTPDGPRTVTFDPFPFNVHPLRVQVNYHQLPRSTYENREAFLAAYFQAPLGVMEFTLT